MNLNTNEPQPTMLDQVLKKRARDLSRIVIPSRPAVMPDADWEAWVLAMQGLGLVPLPTIQVGFEINDKQAWARYLYGCAHVEGNATLRRAKKLALEAVAHFSGCWRDYIQTFSGDPLWNWVTNLMAQALAQSEATGSPEISGDWTAACRVLSVVTVYPQVPEVYGAHNPFFGPIGQRPRQSSLAIHSGMPTWPWVDQSTLKQIADHLLISASRPSIPRARPLTSFELSRSYTPPSMTPSSPSLSGSQPSPTPNPQRAAKIRIAKLVQGLSEEDLTRLERFLVNRLTHRMYGPGPWDSADTPTTPNDQQLSPTTEAEAEVPSGIYVDEYLISQDGIMMRRSTAEPRQWLIVDRLQHISINSGMSLSYIQIVYAGRDHTVREYIAPHRLSDRANIFQPLQEAIRGTKYA